MITINVESVGAVEISDREDYLELLKTEGVKGLMKDGVRESYKGLVHNGTYTLGPPIEQKGNEQQNGKFLMRYYFCIFLVSFHFGSFYSFSLDLSSNLSSMFLAGTNVSPDQWYSVSGTITRPVSHAGARYEMYKLAFACKGLYPADSAGQKQPFVTVETGSDERSNLSFEIMFREMDQAAEFNNGLGMYLRKNEGQLVLTNNEGSVVNELTTIMVPSYPIDTNFYILETHYVAQNDEAQLGSPVVDMLIDVCTNDDITADVTLLSRRDPTFVFQRFENDLSFVLADPESAHIFPSSKCKGIYEWLDKLEYNRLALSRDVHINFAGTARGRGKRRKTEQTFAIRPLRPPSGYQTTTLAGQVGYKIPLELILNVNDIGEGLLSRLGSNAALDRQDGRRWTISGADVALHYPTGRRLKLVTEETDNGVLSLVMGIPGVSDLSLCWSNSPTDLHR